jgi:hypothetical protein
MAGEVFFGLPVFLVVVVDVFVDAVVVVVVVLVVVVVVVVVLKEEGAAPLCFSQHSTLQPKDGFKMYCRF